MNASQRLLLLSLALIVVTAGGCSFAKAKQAGERGVEEFHRQFNAQKYHDIYARADDGFHKATSEADTIALFEAVRRKLGSVKDSKQQGWHVNTTPGGTVATLQYDTEFTEGHASEQFVFYINGDKASLFNYNVNSPLLITK